MSRADLAHRFTYHPPTPEQPEVYALIRDTGFYLALLIEAVGTSGPETTRAIQAVEEAVMWANAAVARQGLPASYPGTATVLLQTVRHQLHLARPNSALTTDWATPEQATVAADRNRGSADVAPRPATAQPATQVRQGPDGILMYDRPIPEPFAPDVRRIPLSLVLSVPCPDCASPTGRQCPGFSRDYTPGSPAPGHTSRLQAAWATPQWQDNLASYAAEYREAPTA